MTKTNIFAALHNSAEEIFLEVSSSLLRYHSSKDAQSLREVRKTEKTANLAPNDDGLWRFSCSIEALSIFAAACLRKKRKSGHVKECTHYMEVASHAVAYGKHLDLPDTVIAFAAYAHDISEDNRKIIPRMIVQECWHGDEKCRPLLTYVLTQITDDPKLHGQERLNAQIHEANKDSSRLTALVRWSDKYCTLLRDFQDLEKGKMPLGSFKKFRKNYTSRKKVVLNLNIPRELKELHIDLVRKVENNLEEKGLIPPKRRRSCLGFQQPETGLAL